MPRSLRSSNVARLQTRATTSVLDGDFKEERQKAEKDIAETVCRHAVVKAGTQKWSIPRNKLREVFERMAFRVYTGYQCKLPRVKGLVYKMLRKRAEEQRISRRMDFSSSSSEDEEEEQKDASDDSSVSFLF